MRRFWILLSLAALLSATIAQAQSTCGDRTTSRASGRGACSHHGGVAKPADRTPTTTRGSSGDIVLPTTPAPRASARAQERASDNSRVSEQAGSTKVWVNTKSGVYHRPFARAFDTPLTGTLEWIVIYGKELSQSVNSILKKFPQAGG